MIVELGIASVFGIVGGIGLWSGIKKHKQYLRFARAKESPVGSAEGFAQIRGKVSAPDATLTSDAAQKQCVFYDTRIAEIRTSSGSGGRRNDYSSNRYTVWSHKEHTPFMVSDGTGSMRIDPAAAQFMLTDRYAWRSRRGLLSYRTPTIEELKQQGLESIAPISLMGGSSYWYLVESTLEIDDTINVIGTFSHGMLVKSEQPAIITDRAAKELGVNAILMMAVGYGVALVGFGVFGIIVGNIIFIG